MHLQLYTELFHKDAVLEINAPNLCLATKAIVLYYYTSKYVLDSHKWYSVHQRTLCVLFSCLNSHFGIY